MTQETPRPVELSTFAKAQTVVARVVPGHGVASGRNGDPRFPGGTIRMQSEHFRGRGIDLGRFHLGTVNVSIAPHAYRVIRPRHTIRQLKWHLTEPAEDFSFFDVKVAAADGKPVDGLIYFPHPDTKPTHFQSPAVLELLLPFIEGLKSGMELTLTIPASQMEIIRATDEVAHPAG